MIKFNKTEVFNFEGAIRGMRNPLESWDKSDSRTEKLLCHKGGISVPYNWVEPLFIFGENDLSLAQKLIGAGSDHSKFMRQILVSVDITAPDYWWVEESTYKIGTVENSTSTMHKILSKQFSEEMFSIENLRGYKKNINQFPNEIDEDSEIWKEWNINPLYHISNQGRVKRKEYIASNGSTYRERVLVGSKHLDGYVYVSLLMSDGTRKQKTKHRLAASTFIDNKDNYKEVNHKDGNKMNNHISNLEWVSSSQNQIHAIKEKLQPKAITTYKGKLTKKQRDDVIEKFNSSNISRKQLAEEYSVSHTTICSIINNKYNYGEGYFNEYENFILLLNELNDLRDEWIETKNKEVWYQVIQKLPKSFNYTRTCTFNYAVLRNMYFSRRNHKLSEWREFCDWVETLPYAKELICYKRGEKYAD